MKKPKRNGKGQYLKGEQGGYVGQVRYKFTDEALKKYAIDLFRWVDENVKNKKEFLLGDWCFESGFPLNHFERHMPKCELLKEAHSYAKAWQAHMICKGALYKKLEPGFSKFMLACVHGWRENQQEEDKKEVLSNDFAKFNLNMEILKKDNEEKSQ